jgi:hypothetical protein
MHEPEESYVGTATIEGTEVEVSLRGRFDAIDGHFHWYGRIAAEPAIPHASGASVVLTTPHGSAEGKLSDLDPWGRLRITGTGTPPF